MRHDERDAAPVPGPRAGIYVGGVALDELVGGPDVAAARDAVERGWATFFDVLCAMRFVRAHERSVGVDDALSMFTPPMRRLVDGLSDAD